MTVEIVVPIPALLEHQTPDAIHPARFKVLRKGRRWGKDRLAYNVAWFGHGPDHYWPGILDGWDVAWLAPDFKQGRGIWGEEVLPRFGNDQVPGVSLNQQDKTVILEGCGGLYFYSAENMKAIRGLGKRLKGVIINEAAYLDLASAWRDVIRPILMDNIGWAIIMSTTNAGTDGGEDEQGNRRVPSFFNTICDEIQTGQRAEDWYESYGTAADNPKIGASEFAAVVAEYPVGSVSLDQEIYAKLLVSGAGLAFPEWRDDLHTLEAFSVPDHWQYGAGFDWGYWQPSVLTLFAHGEESQTVGIGEGRWVQKDGFDIGVGIADACGKLDRPVEWIAADSSIWGVPADQKKGFPNLAEEIQAGIFSNWNPRTQPPVLFAVPKGHESRLMRANLLHKYLKGDKPRLRFLKSCGQCITTIPKLPVDPLKPEDVDTTSDDHAYDSTTYFLLSRPPIVETPNPQRWPDDDTHPGLNWPEGKRHRKRFGGPVEEPVQEWVPDGRLVATEI